MRIWKYALALGAMVLAGNVMSGCSGAGSVNPPATTHVVTFKTTATATYTQDSLIAAPAEHAIPDGTTFTAATYTTTASIFGKTAAGIANAYTPSTIPA